MKKTQKNGTHKHMVYNWDQEINTHILYLHAITNLNRIIERFASSKQTCEQGVSYLHTHLKIQVAQPVVEIRGDEGFNLFKLVQLCAGLAPDQWRFEPVHITETCHCTKKCWWETVIKVAGCIFLDCRYFLWKWITAIHFHYQLSYLG